MDTLIKIKIKKKEDTKDLWVLVRLSKTCIFNKKGVSWGDPKYLLCCFEFLIAVVASLSLVR